MPALEPGVGDLVRAYRTELNWTRQRLAREMHRSVSWLAQVERGELQLVDVHLLGRLETILGARRNELIDVARGPRTTAELSRPYVEVLRLALAGRPTTGVAADVKVLGRRVRAVWDKVHASAYREAGPELAALIGDLEAAHRSGTSEVSEHLASAYQAAAAVLVKVGDHGAGWVAADRAIAAVERCGRPDIVLASQLRMARTLLDSQERVLARHVLRQATERARAAIASGEPGTISLVGSCALLLAVLTARESDSASAHQNLDVARLLAGKVATDANFHETEFCSTNVAMHAVAVAVELGNAQEALDLVNHVRDADRLSPERQARYLVDVARAHVLKRSGDQALRALMAAERAAPEELAELPLAVTVLDDIDALTPHAPPPALRELRRRLAR